MKTENVVWVIIVSIIWAISLLGLSSMILTVQNKESKTINIDIHDRENGICADMYKEGFEWGYGQIPLQISIWRMEGKSETLIKELLWDWLSKEPNKLK